MISARSTFLFVCVVVVSLAMVASAAPAGDFTARYSLGAPAAAGEAVQITISLAVANNTSSDITKSWQKGSSPAMSVSFSDANGAPVRTFIEF